MSLLLESAKKANTKFIFLLRENESGKSTLLNFVLNYLLSGSISDFRWIINEEKPQRLNKIEFLGGILYISKKN